MRQKLTRFYTILLFVLVLFVPRSFGQTAPAGPGPTLDAAQKLTIIDEISRILNQRYIFPETAKKVEEALRAKLKEGGFDQQNEVRTFAQAVSRVILAVSKDKHMGFSYNPEQAADMRRIMGRSEEEARQVRERQLQTARRDNFGFRKVERLSGNVGYLDFRVFASPDRAGETAIAALNFLAYCDAIIVDLRQNGGGDPAQIQLICSYFFREPVHLNDLYIRESGETENYWSLPYVPGPKPVDADLYILTSSRTFSGAEEFTYNMKNLKRATVIGETTGGGAHPTDAAIVSQDYILRVPMARAINPVSKTNWEGTGVTPDIACPAAEAFDKAYALALEKLAAKAKEPQRKAEYEWTASALKAKAAPVQVDEKTLQSYAGTYGARKITFENGTLFYQRVGPKARLIPMTQTLFAIDGIENFRLEFVVKDGRAVEVIGRYDNGDNDKSARAK